MFFLTGLDQYAAVLMDEGVTLASWRRTQHAYTLTWAMPRKAAFLKQKAIDQI